MWYLLKRYDGTRTQPRQVHENLHMTKVCAQVVSKLLISDQKEKRQEICADIAKQIEENSKFLDSRRVARNSQ